MSKDSDILTTVEVADRLGVHRSTVIRMIHSGKLKALAVGAGTQHKQWRVKASSLDDLEFEPKAIGEVPLYRNIKPLKENILSRFSKKYGKGVVN